MAQRWGKDFLTRGPWRPEDIPWLSTNVDNIAEANAVLSLVATALAATPADAQYERYVWTKFLLATAERMLDHLTAVQAGRGDAAPAHPVRRESLT